MKLVACSATVPLLVLCLAAPAEAGDERAEGQKLFEKHGCTNCHGPNGVHPTSRYVPVLRGKPADYIVENATAIFG